MRVKTMLIQEGRRGSDLERHGQSFSEGNLAMAGSVGELDGIGWLELQETERD